MEAWIPVIAGMAAVVILFLAAVLSRRRTMAYTGPADRDLRLDLLRGGALALGVGADVTLGARLAEGQPASPLLILAVQLFVLASGAGIGMQYRPAAASGGAGEVVVRAFARAWRVYLVALSLTVVVLLLSLVPFVRTDVLSALPGEGQDVLAGARGVLRYPVDPAAVLDIVLLRAAPWQVGVLGLFVVLLAVAPLVLWLLSRRGWALALILSAGLYIVGGVTGAELLPTGFEGGFPILAWQVLFVVGLISGYYRRELVAWFAARTGRAVLLPLALLGVAGAAVSFGRRLPVEDTSNAALDAVLDALFAGWYRGTLLDPGPLLTVLIIALAAYALLSVYWKPISAALGWLLLPLGRFPLVVVVLQLLLVLVLATILPPPADGAAWVDPVIKLAILALLWVAVLSRSAPVRGRHA